ncbi:S-adenosyl-L-methionine-dependent methyltransferase [Armillaria borealis]|uniref:S-adenosyl-L-methionine-dependent methyltransferase n=1 Tax=Armillaria borealis TaxID=47425 RepID=A0AA39JUE8_9AGAR|nr:S-adenosyl-L-methionine-dependent methyltransferase [Armillaria borealis]
MPGHIQNIESYSAEDNSSGLVDSDVEELRSDDFPSYFVESNGRLFHSSLTCPYPLPVDTPEQQRLNVIHNALFCLIGTHYVGPVPELLMSEPGRQKIVVDMCSGTGKWVMEMAELYPLVRFYGLDIVPIATQYPLPNVDFELHDVGVRTRYQDGSIDLVHARSVSMTVRDYGEIIQEVKRILRPGGMFVSGEWGQHPLFHPSYNLDPASQTPSLFYFFQVLHRALARCGIPPVAGTIDAMLQSAGGFVDITPQIHYLPIGPWSNDHIMQRIGKAFRTVLSRYMDSVRPIILGLGMNESDLDHLYADARAEVASAQGLVAVYYSVHARRM